MIEYAARWDFLGSCRIGPPHASIGAADADAEIWRRERWIGNIGIVAFKAGEFRDLNAAEREAERRLRERGKGKAPPKGGAFKKPKAARVSNFL